ncbi:MAG: trigger factor [Blastocatellia bacterium]|jgi:trigger factor|nr:trigger factor [Blastocatellia bacterium]
MKSEVINVSETRKEIKIEIEPEVVKAAYDRISDTVSKNANVPGFRRGHVPRSVIRKRFKEAIEGEVMQELLPPAINDAINEHGLAVIGQPDLQPDKTEGLANLGDEALRVNVGVEVFPEIKLGEFKGLTAERRVRPVTDEQVENVLTGLRESAASLQPVEDRGSQLGDTVTVNINGKFLDTPDAEDINVDDVDIQLGGEGVQQEFTDNLLDVRPDDEKSFQVNYPEDFSSKGLAGKRLDYTAKVTAVRLKELPALDDEWAQSLGDDLDSMETLRKKIREDLEERSSGEAQSNLRNALLQQLVDAHPFEVPQTLLEHQTNQNLQSVVRNMIDRGMDPRSEEFDWQKARDSLKGQAERDLRGSLLLDRIADEEKIEVSDEEVNTEIKAYAEATRQSEAQVRSALTKQGGERSIADRLRNRKALELLVENASVTDASWIAEPETDAPGDVETT